MAFLLVFCDQVSKFFILRFFPQIIVYNKGIAFGFLASKWWILINFFILMAIVRLIKRKLPLVLIISGGLSNILDRIIRGAVIDFINVKFRLRNFSFEVPIFNLADVFICLGVGIMILLFCGRTKDYFSGQ